jgi:hypothetical protein
LLASVRDMSKIDGGITRAAFKGLVPFFIARKILEKTIYGINNIEGSDVISRSVVWPFAFLFGAMLAHPFYLIGLRTQAAPFE